MEIVRVNYSEICDYCGEMIHNVQVTNLLDYGHYTHKKCLEKERAKQKKNTFQLILAMILTIIIAFVIFFSGFDFAGLIDEINF